MADIVDKMAAGFKSMEELKAYSNAQFNTIQSLNKKIKELQAERDELKKLVVNTAPLLTDENNQVLKNPFEVSDEESIAIMQIRRLKQISMEREFTKEESTIYDIMNRNLIAIRNAPKTIKVEGPKNLTDKELLKLLEAENE